MSPIRTISILALLVAGACDDNDSDAVTDAVDEGQAKGETFAEDADRELGDRDEPTTLGMTTQILLTVDEGEVLHAELALERANDAEVLAFAEQMIADHEAHMAQTHELIAGYLLSPIESSVSTQLRADAMAGLQRLAAASDFDYAYMQMQVTMHQQAFVLASSLDDEVADGEFQTFLDLTQATIEGHREHAEDVFSRQL